MMVLWRLSYTILLSLTLVPLGSRAVPERRPAGARALPLRPRAQPVALLGL